MKYILIALALFLGTAVITQAAPFSWDYISGSNIVRLMSPQNTATVQVPAITATTSTSTLSTLAVSTRLSFGGVIGTAWSDFCVSITGGSGLCDGTDDTGGGTGDVVGPTTATDNAIARFDTTTGKLLQNSSVVVTDAGYVGIGTTSPATLLTLQSSLPNGTYPFTVRTTTSSGEFFNLLNNAGTQVFALNSDGANNFFLSARNNAGSDVFTIEPTAGYVTTQNSLRLGVNDATPDYMLEATGSAGNGFFGISNTTDGDILTVNSSGFLGLGSSSPTHRLTVNGTSLFAGEVALNGTNSNINLGSNYLSGDGGDEGVFIGSTGNVGIGTTTPTHPLSVISTNGFAPTVLFENTGLGTGTEVLLTLRSPLTTSLTTGRLLQAVVPGESFARAFWYSDGAYCVGAGFATRDLCYSRISTSTLRIDSNKSGGSANLTVTGTTTTSNLSIGSLTGVLKATAGTVATGLVDLASEVTGRLGITNGGTGTSTAPTTDQILVGNSGGSFDYRRIVAGTNVTVSTSTAGQIQISSTGGSGSFTVGPTSTPIWRSTLQGWTFPDGQYVNTEIQANRFHTIKPIWYEIDNAGADIGTLDQRPSSGAQPFGYNASNTQIIKENSTEQFVTISGNDPEIHTLTGSSTLVASETAEIIAFATSTGFTGIELDWEGFGSWTAGETTNYINFVTYLSNEAHKYGLKTMIYLPPIWNSCSNCESGSGDEWDSANSDGYYQLEYEDFENVPVDYLLIAVYDYHFDYSAGRPNAPLKWQDDIISYAKRKISDHDRLIIGIPGAGYGGATGGYSFTAYTYGSSTAIAGFSGATRDSESGELTWTNGGNSYFACDDTCINTKRARAEREGISRVSVWHIGGNTYGSGKAEPTIHTRPLQYLSNLVAQAGNFISNLVTRTFTVQSFLTLQSTTTPATPAAGSLNVFRREIAGRSMPAYIGPSGLDSALQPLLARNKVGYWNPPGNGTTVPGVFGFTAPTVTGFTATARNVATTRLFTRMRRLGYVTAATAGAVGQWRVAASQYTVGSSTTPIGGFTYIVRFGISDAAAVSGARMFMGMGQGGTTPTNVEPSTVVKAIGMCHGAADTNFKICYGGSSAQTPIDLGANFPSNTLSTDMYELALFAAPNTGDIKYEVTRLNTGDVATGTITNTSAAVLPQNGTLMAPWGYRTNNATALAVGLDVASAYIETDY